MWLGTTGGAILGSTLKGVTITRDMGCSFELAGGAAAASSVVDLAGNPSDAANVLALTSSFAGNDDAGEFQFVSRILETTNGGQTFASLPGLLPAALRGETLDLAASDGTRLYVSALQDAIAGRTGFLLTSRDRGATFESHVVPLVGEERSLFIAAVDPTNADRVYLRTDSAELTPGRLIVSHDAGKTFRTAFTSRGRLAGFALSKDGSRVYVGGPQDGVQVASTSDLAFEQRTTMPIECLALGDDGLWGCSTEGGGFVAGISNDDGASFRARLKFCEINGLVSCPAGAATNDRCNWPQQRKALGCQPREPSVDAGSEAGPEPAASEGDAGCSCGPGRSSPGAFVALSGIAALALARAARRRRQ